MYARNAQESRKNRFRPTGRRFLTDHMHGKLLYPAFRPADVPINSLGRRLQIRRKTMGVTDSTDEWTDRHSDGRRFSSVKSVSFVVRFRWAKSIQPFMYFKFEI